MTTLLLTNKSHTIYLDTSESYLIDSLAYLGSQLRLLKPSKLKKNLGNTQNHSFFHTFLQFSSTISHFIDLNADCY